MGVELAEIIPPSKVTGNPIFSNLMSENLPLRARLDLIKRIESKTGRALIVYTANPNHVAYIKKEDIFAIEDLLRSVSMKKCDLMINSKGGMLDAAEKILLMCRDRFDEFNVIVPDYAKSAATMIALGSDKIIMRRNFSELGPIDPQIPVVTGGVEEVIPARAFKEGLENIRKKSETDGTALYSPMLYKVRIEILQMCENAINESQVFAKKWLGKHMLKSNKKRAAAVARHLCMGKEYMSHGKVIDLEEAKKLGLKVEEMDDELWSMVWELYCRSVLILMQNNSTKLFESGTVSLTSNETAPGKR